VVSVSVPQLRRAAWLAFGLHVLAGFAMLFVLRHGLATNPDFLDRIEFLSRQKALWIAAWLVWNLAALSIVYFYVVFAIVHGNDGRSNPIALVLAVVLGTAAIVADLGAEGIEMGILPSMAPTMTQATYPLFLALDRMAVMATGYVANTLYTLAAVLLAWSTRHAYSRWVVAAGLGVGVFGLILSGATLADSVFGMFWSNAFLVPCISAWLIGVALTAGEG